MRMTLLDEPAAPGVPEHGDDLRGTGPGWMPPEQYAETVPKATCFACLYFTDEDDRPLQLRSVYSPAHPWQLVGGTMDPGERPWQTAVRECAEETGLTVTGPPRLLATVYGLPGDEWPYSTIGCVFDGGRLSPAQIDGIVLNPEEHDECGSSRCPRGRPDAPARLRPPEHRGPGPPYRPGRLLRHLGLGDDEVSGIVPSSAGKAVGPGRPRRRPPPRQARGRDP